MEGNYLAQFQFCSVAQQPKYGPDRLVLRFLDHTHTHTHTHTLGNTPLKEWPARRRSCPLSYMFRRKRGMYCYIHSDCEKFCFYNQEHIILHGKHTIKTRQWIDSQAINSLCSHLKVVNMFCNHKTSQKRVRWSRNNLETCGHKTRSVIM